MLTTLARNVLNIQFIAVCDHAGRRGRSFTRHIASWDEMGKTLAAATAMYRGCTDGAQEVPGVFGPFCLNRDPQFPPQFLSPGCGREMQEPRRLLAKVTPQTAS